MYTIVTFVPREHTEAVLDSVFAAGAGRAGNYDRCCFIVRGEGRFRPRAGSSPFLGTLDKEERVSEDRLEFAVVDDRVEPVLAALRETHPYEEPAIYLTRLDTRGSAWK